MLLHMAWFDHSGFGGSPVKDRVSDALLVLLEGMAAHSRYGVPDLSRVREDLLAQERYRRAARRLELRGMVAYITRKGRRVLELTDEAKAGLPWEVDPQRRWKVKWNGTWYVMSYDVPEVECHDRVVLRTFLKRHRFGLLHRSVWITPFDCRAWYRDLQLAAGVNDVAYLMQVKGFVGMKPERVVDQSWPWDEIGRAHRWYLEQAEAVERRVQNGGFRTRKERISLLEENAVALKAAFSTDPLLPRALHPPGYLGPQVVEASRGLTRRVAEAT